MTGITRDRVFQDCRKDPHSMEMLNLEIQAKKHKPRTMRGCEKNSQGTRPPRRDAGPRGVRMECSHLNPGRTSRCRVTQSSPDTASAGDMHWPLLHCQLSAFKPRPLLPPTLNHACPAGKGPYRPQEAWLSLQDFTAATSPHFLGGPHDPDVCT